MREDKSSPISIIKDKYVEWSNVYSYKNKWNNQTYIFTLPWTYYLELSIETISTIKFNDISMHIPFIIL